MTNNTNHTITVDLVALVQNMPEHKYSQDFDEQQAKLAPADRVVVTCKMHRHAHDYTKCPVCFQQYCAHYWSDCPQCNRNARTTDD